jgi:hypothetical protein
MRAVFTVPHPVLIMYTSSSRTDSVMVTFVSPIPLRVISAFERGSPMLEHEVNEYSGSRTWGEEKRRALPSCNDLGKFRVARSYKEQTH